MAPSATPDQDQPEKAPRPRATLAANIGTMLTGFTVVVSVIVNLDKLRPWFLGVVASLPGAGVVSLVLSVLALLGALLFLAYRVGFDKASKRHRDESATLNATLADERHRTTALAVERDSAQESRSSAETERDAECRRANDATAERDKAIAALDDLRTASNIERTGDRAARDKAVATMQSELAAAVQTARMERDAAVAKALDDGAEMGRKEADKATLTLPLTKYFHAEVFVSSDRRYGIIVRRGGHSLESAVDLRLGIRITNLSPNRIVVCKTSVTRVLFDGVPLSLNADPEVVSTGVIEPWSHGSPIDDVRVNNFSPMHLPPMRKGQPVRVFIECVFTVTGPWGGDPRSHVFNGEILVTPTFEYTRAMTIAVDSLRRDLFAQQIELVDADLRPIGGGNWAWEMEVGPRIQVVVLVPEHTPEEAFRKDKLDDAVVRAAEAIRDRFGTSADARKSVGGDTL